jgi:methionyl-tRNA formyltransferase
MKIIFWGTPAIAVPSLERLLQHPDCEVLAVVTQPDKRRGRGAELIPSPVKAIATQHHLPVYQPRSVKKDPETLNPLRQAAADFFIVVAYGQILSEEILQMPRLGCINAHASILPRYRGAAPIQWSLYEGEAETGITTMLMDVGMDTGAILLKATTPIELLDNAENLSNRLAQIAADLLIETMLGLQQGKIQPIPQDSQQATYARLLQKKDFLLDWHRSAIALHNQIRGFYPNCTTTFRGHSLKVTASMPLGGVELNLLPAELQVLVTDWQPWVEQAQEQAIAPGTVVGLLKKQGAVIQTGAGLLLLREAQLPGKRSQTGWDFVNGTRLVIGERLGGDTVE